MKKLLAIAVLFSFLATSVIGCGGTSTTKAGGTGGAAPTKKAPDKEP